MRRLAVAAVVAALASACTVGPDYSRPDISSPDKWRIDYPQAADVANTRWWEQFGDPALNQLIDTALRNNQDLFIAAARVDQFVGQLAVVRSQFYPQIGYSANASRNRASEVGQPPLAPGADPYYTLYQGALSAQWQIDLFGRVRRQSEAAQAQVYASEQGRRGVILTLVTSVASSYIGLRALDRQLEIAQATAKNYADTARIFELRFKGGVVSEVELQPGRVAVPAGARGDPRARAADRRAGEPDLGPARPQSRGRSRAARRSTSWSRPGSRPTCPPRSSSAGPTSCRPSRS